MSIVKVCDICDKKMKGNLSYYCYLEYFPEYDGSIYQFCSRKCLIEHMIKDHKKQIKKKLDDLKDG